MTIASSAGQICILLLNSNNVQHHPAVITPPIYCKLKRYNRNSPTSNQEIVAREFDVVANAYGLQQGILLLLSPLPRFGYRYGLTIKVRDALGFRFTCHRPIMLTQYGQVNESLLREQKRFT